MTRPHRFNLRRFVLDILAPVLAVWALHSLYYAAHSIETLAPVTAWLLRFWLVLTAALGFWAAYRIGESAD